MNLRTQMLLAGALTLAVPVIGWQSVKQLDESLRQTRVDAQSLKVANARLALAEADELRDFLQLSRTKATKTDLYAEAANFPMFVDGYADEWQNLSSPVLTYKNNEDELRVRLASRGKRLYLFADVRDDEVVYHKPPAPRFDLAEGETLDRQAMLVNGDALELLIADSRNQIEHALFRTVAPGPIVGMSASENSKGRVAARRLARYKGFWVATPQGFHLELSMPLPPPSSVIGLAFVDIDTPGESRTRWLGTLDPLSMAAWHIGESSNAPGNIFFASPIADERLAPWVTRGTRARLFDRQGRLLSDINSLYEKTEEEYEYDPALRGFFNAILFRIFAYFVADAQVNDQPFKLTDGLHLPSDDVDALAEKQAETKHYVTQERDVVLGTLLPVGGDEPNGFLLFESNEDLASAYSSSSVARLFSLLTLVSLLAGLVLLIYASLLSMRIRSLSRLATRAVAEDGRVRGLPQSDAKDEIGDLSRKLSALLERSANYTKYLEALSSRLSHELRTPLSVVKTSIENMDRDRLDAETVQLMDRASGGADQLGAIIRALVESTRLEQTVQQSQMQPVNLIEWLQGSLARYKQVYPNTRITTRVAYASGRRDNLEVYAAAELLLQAFDKLVDNGVAFSNDDAVVLLLESFVENGRMMVLLAVANNGPHIPGELQAQLFDPMFSDRTTDDGELHMGLGLYIVRMIAEAHQGRVYIRNTRNGVEVGLIIPL